MTTLIVPNLHFPLFLIFDPPYDDVALALLHHLGNFGCPPPHRSTSALDGASSHHNLPLGNARCCCLGTGGFVFAIDDLICCHSEVIIAA